jgi:serine/threonine protein kinase
MYSEPRLEPGVVRRYAGAICLAIGHLHSFDLMVRELTPDCCELAADGGHIQLAQLGLTKRQRGRDGDTPPLPHAHTLVGTPEYMAPEVSDAAQDALQPETRARRARRRALTCTQARPDLLPRPRHSR